MLRHFTVCPLIALAFSGCAKSKKHDAPSPHPQTYLNPAGTEVFTQCNTRNRTLRWAQHVVDTDLMQAYGTERQLDMKNEKVAVIDSGFDGNLRKYFPGTVDTFPATEQSASPEIDSVRHGTFVTGLIGARDYGVAPGVTLAVYKLGGTNDSYPYEDVYNGALKACRAGYKLINVSQGFWPYEFDAAKEMKDFANILTEMQERGCLMIKAAGNSAVAGRAATMDLNDGVLQVEGASVSRSLSKFSNDGEVRAPGSLVASLKEADLSRMSCESTEYPAGVSNGTSFAAPIVTGILAHVQAHLSASSDYQNLTTALQIQLLNNIIKASELEGVVNGYRAVMIASHWNKEAMQAEALKALLDPLCPASETLPSCPETQDVDAFLSCSMPLRRRLALCPQTVEPAAMTSFLKYLANRNAADLWLNYARLVQQPEAINASAAKALSVLQQSIPGHRDVDSNTSWLEGLDLLAATDLLLQGSNLTEPYLIRFFRASALIDALSKAPGRDGQLSRKLPEVLDRLKQGQGDLMIPAFAEAYKSWETYMLALASRREYRPNIIDSVGRIRLFNIMQAATSGEGKATVSQLEDSFVALLQKSVDDRPEHLVGPVPSLPVTGMIRVKDEPRETAWDGELLFDFYQRKGIDGDAIVRDQLWESTPTSFCHGAAGP